MVVMNEVYHHIPVTTEGTMDTIMDSSTAATANNSNSSKHQYGLVRKLRRASHKVVKLSIQKLHLKKKKDDSAHNSSNSTSPVSAQANSHDYSLDADNILDCYYTIEVDNDVHQVKLLSSSQSGGGSGRSLVSTSGEDLEQQQQPTVLVKATSEVVRLRYQHNRNAEVMEEYATTTSISTTSTTLKGSNSIAASDESTTNDESIPEEKDTAFQQNRGRKETFVLYYPNDDSEEKQRQQQDDCGVPFFRRITCGALPPPLSSSSSRRKTAIPSIPKKTTTATKKQQKKEEAKLAWLGSPVDGDDNTSHSDSASSDQYVLESATVGGDDRFRMQHWTPSASQQTKAVVVEGEPLRKTGQDNNDKDGNDANGMAKRQWHKQYLQQSVQRLLRAQNSTVESHEPKEEAKDDKPVEESATNSTTTIKDVVIIVQSGKETREEAKDTKPLEENAENSSTRDVVIVVQPANQSKEEWEEYSQPIEESSEEELLQEIEETENELLNEILEEILPLEDPVYRCIAQEEKDSSETAPNDQGGAPRTLGFANFDEFQFELNFANYEAKFNNHDVHYDGLSGEEKKEEKGFDTASLLLEEELDDHEKMQKEIASEHRSSMSAGNICRDLEDLQDLRRPLEIAAAKLTPPPPPSLPFPGDQIPSLSNIQGETIRENSVMDSRHDTTTIGITNGGKETLSLNSQSKRAEEEGEVAKENDTEEVIQRLSDTTFMAHVEYESSLDISESTSTSCKLARARGSIFDDVDDSVGTEESPDEAGSEDDVSVILNAGILDDDAGRIPARKVPTSKRRAFAPMSSLVKKGTYDDKPFDEITIASVVFDTESIGFAAREDASSEASTVSTLEVSVTMHPNDVLYNCIGVDFSQAIMQQVDKYVDGIDIYSEELDDDTIGETIGEESYERLVDDGYQVYDGSSF